MASVVESHPKRNEIVDALLAGESLREVGQRYGIAPMTVSRFKTKIVKPAVLSQTIDRRTLTMRPGAEEVVQHIQEVANGTKASAALAPVLERLAKRQARRESLLDSSANDKDYRGFAALDGCEHKDIRLECELSGLLTQAPTQQTNVMIVCAAGTEPEPPEQGVVEISAMVSE